MSRKDTIIITVLINLGLLAILFATAVIYDDDTITSNAPPEIRKSLSAVPSPLERKENKSSELAVVTPIEMPTDEVDNVLSGYVNNDGQDTLFEDVLSESKEELVADAQPLPQGDFIEVTIKRGDALEKLARANHTTVSAIMKENDLRSERLSVGQTLRIPLGKKKNSHETAADTPKKEVELAEKQYYVVKNGDSPWKIAKQFNVKFEDLLTLNGLDEEKARNLKIGDKIRIK